MRLRRGVIQFGLAAMLLSLSFPVGAQQTMKVARMGFLDPSTASANAVRLEAFWHEIRKLGWIEGKNIIIESRFAEQDPKRLAELATNLVGSKVDLIVVAGNDAAVAAKNATSTIPIVLTASGDPVAFLLRPFAPVAEAQLGRVWGPRP